MENNKEVNWIDKIVEKNKAIDAIINLASALGIPEKDLADILEEAIVFDNENKYTDKTVAIVKDLVTSPELNINDIKLNH